MVIILHPRPFRVVLHYQFPTAQFPLSQISLSESQAGQPATPLPDMRLTACKQAFPNKGFTQQQFNVLFCPIFGRQRLQKHHDALEIHSDEFV